MYQFINLHQYPLIHKILNMIKPTTIFLLVASTFIANAQITDGVLAPGTIKASLYT